MFLWIPFSLALQTALHLPDLPTCRNRKGPSLEAIPKAEWVLHVWQCISAFRETAPRHFPTAFGLFPLPLTGFYGRPWSMDQRKLLFQWQVPGIFLSDRVGGSQGTSCWQCPPVPALSRPREGSALGRAVGEAGRTDRRTRGRQVVLGLHTSRCMVHGADGKTRNTDKTQARVPFLQSEKTVSPWEL